MINKEQAEKIVYKHLALLEKESGVQLKLINTETIEKEFGWIFFYNSKKYIETGEFRYMLAGNAPIIVNKKDGSLYETGTSQPIDCYVTEYVKKHNGNQST